jgi:LmbE family N-acetylglucosaminyl deacetylase
LACGRRICPGRIGDGAWMTKQADAILEILAGWRTLEPRVMIVVPHPDDETIGMGAQLWRFHNALLIHVTDGAPGDGRDAAAHGFASIADYALARRAELRDALEAGRAFGVRTEVVGIRDQEACLHLVTLTERILRCLQQEAPAVIFLQPYEGGHPDHDAAAFAVQAAARLVVAGGGLPPPIIEMTAYHADGPRLATGAFLPADLPVRTLKLDAADRARKRRMIDCFISQRDLLAQFDTAVERFREAPHYDFAQPPHSGELHYERLGWSITGEVWRRHAQAALDALGLRSPPWV